MILSVWRKNRRKGDCGRAFGLIVNASPDPMKPESLAGANPATLANFTTLRN